MSDHHPNRRRLIGMSAAVAGVAAGGAAIVTTRTRRASDYEAAVRATWQPSDLRQPGLMRGLVHAATLAANSHNTQPWRFRFHQDQISVHPNPARRCPAVDPDDHHLFVSLGCAVENIVQAAREVGINAMPSFYSADDSVHVALHPGAPRASSLAAAIPLRQSTRADFDGRPLSTEQLGSLAAAGRDEDVDLLLITDRTAIETVLAAVIEGNTAQVNDPAFVQELRRWLRFSYADALGTRDGLFSGCTGNPVAPDLIGRALFGLFYTAASENQKYVGQIRSSSGIAVIASKMGGKAGWVAAGRAFQRFALQATMMDLKLSLLNNPIEVAAIRPQFAAALGLGTRRPDMVVRFGHGPSLPRSMRRPVEQVLA